MELGIIIVVLFVAAGVNIAATGKAVIESVSVLAALIALIGSVMVAIKVSAAGIYSPYPFLSVDSMGAIAMLIISVVGMAAAAYSVPYLREELRRQNITPSQVKRYYIMLNLFLAVMFLAVTSSSPIFTWISIEATTLSTAFLISFYNKPYSMEAAWKYLIINSIGLLLGFFGTLLYFTALIGTHNAGLTTWSDFLAHTAHFDPKIAQIAFVFVLIGYGTKVGLAPMHTWLPDAHSRAPVPISALLSGVLLNVAFIAIIRFKTITDAAIGPAFSQKLLIYIGMLSLFVAALIILTQKDYKRLLAYSSIENMGIIALGFGFGGRGIFVAILHMIYHSLVKSALFLTAGTIFLKYNSTKIVNIRGMLVALPITAILFFVAFFAITGTPPFGIFLTKFFIVSAGIQAHPALSVIAIFLMALLFVGFFKHTVAMMFGAKPDEIHPGEGGIAFVAPPVALIALALYLSLHFPQALQQLVNRAASPF
jgi:hydrogenase-4 component F